MNGHTAYQLIISLSVSIYSGLPGLWIAEILRKQNASFFYFVKNFELTSNAVFYKHLRIDFFVYCIKKTFFRHCNTKIKISKKPDINEIDKLLNEITISELCHFFGFLFVGISQIAALFLGLYIIFFSAFLFNTIFNIYPVLLQERNKLRLRDLITTLD